MKSFLFGGSFLLLIISSPLLCAKKHQMILLEDSHYSIEKKREKDASNPLSNRSLSRKSDNVIWSEDFESNAAGWSFNSGWSLTQASFHSPNSSIFSPNNTTTFDQYFTLFSPRISLPEVGLNEWLYFTFWLNADLPDYNGNDDSLIDDYYQVDVQYPLEKSAFHASSFGSSFGTSFWCGDEDLEGYKDGWVQFLDMPTILIPASGGNLKVNMKWAIEDTEGAEDSNVSEGWIDGWDAINVQISSDGGSTWSILSGDDPYDFYSGYGWVYNGMDPGQSGVHSLASGWSGVQDWHIVNFNLNDYAGQNILIRFAFASDPAYSTSDDGFGNPVPSLKGFFVDDIVFEDGLGLELISYVSEEVGENIFSSEGYEWDHLFYDYNVEFCIDSDLQTLSQYTSKEDCEVGGFYWYSRPGSMGWEEYLPGDPVCEECNYFLDLNKYSGKDVVLRFWARYDGNHDGGQGEGLYIDDINIYRESIQVYSEPQLFNASVVDGEVKLSWYDLNSSGDSLLFFDSQDSSLFNGLTMSECDNCSAFAGTLFPAWLGKAKVDSIMVYNINESSEPSQINAYSLINNDPVHTLDVNLNASSWNSYDVDWDFSSVFLLSYSFSDQVAAAFNPFSTESGLWYLSDDVGAWEYVSLDESLIYGSWALRARVEYEGLEGVTYNIYRDGELLRNSLTGNSFIDSDVAYNANYYYHLGVMYSDGVEIISSDSLTITSPLPPVPDGVVELSNSDDGFEASFNAGGNNYSAVRFENSLGSAYLYMVKWYQVGDGGAFYLYVFDDEGGEIGGQLLKVLQASGNKSGWNQKKLTDEELNLSGDFWVGIQEFSSTQAFGLDTTLVNGKSFYREGASGDWELIQGNLALKSFISIEPLSSSVKALVPNDYGIKDVYPNPFNPIVNINFSAKEFSNIQLNVYDLSGALIGIVFDDFVAPGYHSVSWNASSEIGKKVSSGIYMLMMGIDGKHLSTRKIVFIK